MSDKKISVREAKLIAEARAAMISEEILEEGFFGDLISGIAKLFGSAGGILSLLTGGDGGPKNYKLKVGDNDAISAFSDKAAMLPKSTEAVRSEAKKGLKMVEAAIERVGDPEAKEFFNMAIEESSQRIAAAQEKEVKQITSAIAKQLEHDNIVKIYAGIIVPSALLAALKQNMKK